MNKNLDRKHTWYYCEKCKIKFKTIEDCCPQCLGESVLFTGQEISCLIDTKSSNLEKEVMEQLADIEHQRWADWQRHVNSKFSCSDSEGLLDIPDHIVSKWEQQINTPYSQLSEKDKEKDREQVRRYLRIIENLVSKSHALGMKDMGERIEKWAYNNGITDKKSFNALINFINSKQSVTKINQLKETCGVMILTPTPEHGGGMWCAEKVPCIYHPLPKSVEEFNLKGHKLNKLRKK